MSSKKGFVERRKYKRFNVEEGAFVEFYKHIFFKLGKPRIVKYAQIADNYHELVSNYENNRDFEKPI